MAIIAQKIYRKIQICFACEQMILHMKNYQMIEIKEKKKEKSNISNTRTGMAQ